MSKRKTKRPSRPGQPRRVPHEPTVEDLAAIVVRGGRELLEAEDPLEAEQWASAMLGTFYKLPVPFDVLEMVERELVPTIARLAEGRADAVGRAIVEALAAVLPPGEATELRAAADRLRAAGVDAPAWAAEIGPPVLDAAWQLVDVFGDQEGYYSVFRHPGRPPHMLMALVDKALGGIVKDASVGWVKGDTESMLREVAARDGGLTVEPIEPATMSRRLVDAVESGDLYLDNGWTDGFKHTRALLLARMRTLPLGPRIEPRPVGKGERTRIVKAFLASTGAKPGDDTEFIAQLCLDYTCDYLGDDPYRWSPIVVEQFMLDFLPRKVSLSLADVRVLPDALRAWVRFALGRRGLDARWIEETVEAVGAHEREFAREATNRDAFGPAKQVAASMQADGIDFSDPAAVQAWIDAENHRLP